MEQSCPALSSSKLEFVTISSPQDARASNIRHIVRSHALKDFHKKRRQQSMLHRTVHRTGAPQKIQSRHTSVKNGEGLTNSAEDLSLTVCTSGNTEKNRCDTSRIPHACTDGSIRQALRSPSPRGIVGAGRVDPFSSYPRQLSAIEHFLADFWIMQFSRPVNATYPAGLARSLSTIWFPNAIKDLGLLNGILLEASRDYCHALADSTQTKKLKALTLHYRGNLIRSVAAAINKEWPTCRDQTIAALYALAFDEAATGYWEAFNHHAKALELVVKARGGVSVLGFNGFLGFLIQRIHLISTFYRGEQSSFQSLLVPRAAISVDMLTPGFLARDVIWNISTDLMRMLDDFSTLTNLIDGDSSIVVHSNPIYKHYEEGLHISVIRYQYQFSLTPPFHEPSIQECVSLAAEIYWRCVLVEQDHAHGACGWMGFTDLPAYTAGIAQLLVSEKGPLYLELLLWMAFLGNYTVDIVTTPIVVELSWTKLIARIARDLHITTWDDARTVLRAFLWSDRRCEMVGRELWHQVERVTVKAGEG